MKFLLLALLIPMCSFANLSAYAYLMNIETTFPGKSPIKETIDLTPDSDHPVRSAARFYDTQDGTYLVQFFSPRTSPAHDSNYTLWLPAIVGKIPDPKIGSSLSEMEYGFEKLGDTATIYQHDPARASKILYEMKIQLTQK